MKAAETNTCLPSTATKFKRVIIPAPPGGPIEIAPAGRRRRQFKPRQKRVPLWCSIKYRGGPEGWVEIVTRGETIRVPGWVTLIDLVQTINGERV
jgi:hypothetical protein